jgi:hypothetical protein
MALTMWMNVLEGHRLDQAELEQLRSRARRAYEANTHIFEDEVEALAAMGVLPVLEDEQHELVRNRPGTLDGPAGSRLRCEPRSLDRWASRAITRG